MTLADASHVVGLEEQDVFLRAAYKSCRKKDGVCSFLVKDLMAEFAVPAVIMIAALTDLTSRGLLRRVGGGRYEITDKGVMQAIEPTL